MPLSSFLRVEQIEVSQLAWRKAIDGFLIRFCARLQGIRQRSQQQRQGCEPLLAIDDEQRRLDRDVPQTGFDVHYRTYEMHRDGVVAPRTGDVIPELFAFLGLSRIHPLINRDHKLR